MLSGSPRGRGRLAWRSPRAPGAAEASPRTGEVVRHEKRRPRQVDPAHWATSWLQPHPLFARTPVHLQTAR